MPYRRLPNTDNARFKALKKAFEKGKELPPFKLAFSQSALQKIQSFLPQFETKLQEQKQAYNNQVSKNKDYVQQLKKAKLYISHFIQVLNMAILRGELAPSMRTYYGIAEDNKKLPSLNTEHDVIDWGEKIIAGETARIQKGMTPVTNPTMAVVKVHYENFLDAQQFQKTLQKNTNRALNELAALREDADTIITRIWDEVENSYKDLPEELKREKASDYGVVYVYRKNEINKLQVFENSRISI